ncbi:hypothetical protein A2U01_0020686 [Trifolium medium]|uniref:Uncharacterized protein n=1 Tax=Trifolium medium TaxID=97028 RepID=A0A392NIQ4_9FABA|nr:hypothetical protein [Trifolium medium]
MGIFGWICDQTCELHLQILQCSLGDRYGRWARRARQKPRSSCLWSPVFASRRWATSTGSATFC